MRLALGAVLLLLTPAVPSAAGSADFSDRAISPVPGFRFASHLSCETVVATVSSFVGGHFVLRQADSPAVLRIWKGGSTPSRLPRVHDDAERAVFQLINEDPGSVDTLSLDKIKGTYSRTWSGWSDEGLQAGGERGRCAPTPDTLDREPVK